MNQEPTRNEPAETLPSDPVQVAMQAELRERFRAFLNDDARYRKFIKVCNEPHAPHKGLSYWQQQEWAPFIKENPEYASLATPAIRNAFHVCHVHLTPLKLVQIPIQKETGYSTNHSTAAKAINEFAPYSEHYSLSYRQLRTRTHITAIRCDECLKWKELHQR